MSELTYRAATKDDAAWFAEHLREADRMEVIAASGSKNIEAILAASIASGQTTVAEINGVPSAIFGATRVSIVPSRAIPWMLGTDNLDKHKLLLGRASVKVMNTWREDYDHLINYVDSRNELAVSWLNWLGFDIHEAQPYGPFGQPFHKFQWRRGINV